MLDTKSAADAAIDHPHTREERPLQVLVIAGSARRVNGCPGLDSKARYLLRRMAAQLPAGWQVDLEDISNEHGKPKIQGCNGCVSSSMALCVWPCNCYGPNSDTQPDLLWDLDLYGRLARADAWAFIGPIWWYGPSTNFKLLFDRLVCMNGGNPRPDLIDKKSTLLAQALERSPQWPELNRNHLEGRTAAFFSYGDKGGADIGEDGRPRNLKRKDWFDPADEPQDCDTRDAYKSLVWQCRYSGIEVPDALWQSTSFGVGKLYADDQADDIVRDREPGLEQFDSWVDGFVRHVRAKGALPGMKEAVASAKSTTNV
ncbi:NAD(P)H-dependent oxidoreductase [Terrihabitans rhizophilus]|uniref:NAD(P)H-dependent oxidoreductase n=1 Tax=Terrihabitans rhizophilus TaxID=3092662 RepID=A0ABU4RMV7_9HYPH|nr:NAD(P)H-dependent oxidoreductase [Terrihabitans sp. PJ23]MDX6805434.1 NAD(P)H-dependent oxidoreductase [Terrihabitans sp. PJ23]